MLDEVVMGSAPTLSENASSGITSGVTVQPTDSRFRVCGAPIYSATTSPVYFAPRDPARVDGAEASTRGVGPVRVDFMWQGQVLEFKMFAGSSRNYRIWKDGQLIASSMATSPVTLTVTGASTWVRADFGSRVSAPSHITLEMSGANGLQWGAIVIEPTALLAAPNYPSPRVIWLADSYAAGVGATDKCQSYAILAGRALGWQDVWTHSCVATTGLVTATATYKDYRGRVPIDVTPYNPDLVVIQGSVNDKTAAGLGTVGPALASCISQIKAANPSCKIVVLSPLWMASGAASPDQAAFESIAAEMLATCNAAGVPFIDLITGNPVFRGTGRVGATTGDGNADFFRSSDLIHPGQAGARALAPVVARSIADVLGLSV